MSAVRLPSLEDVKKQAKSLKLLFPNEKYCHILENISHNYGVKDYNTLKALITKQETKDK